MWLSLLTKNSCDNFEKFPIPQMIRIRVLRKVPGVRGPDHLVRLKMRIHGKYDMGNQLINSWFCKNHKSSLKKLLDIFQRNTVELDFQELFFSSLKLSRMSHHKIIASGESLSTMTHSRFEQNESNLFWYYVKIGPGKIIHRLERIIFQSDRLSDYLWCQILFDLRLVKFTNTCEFTENDS